MSKITIFLCAVLFAAAVDATFLTTRLMAAQQRVESFVTAKIEDVERIYENAKKRIEKLSEKLDKTADDFGDKIAEDITKLEVKLTKDIKMLIEETKGVDLSECDISNEVRRNILDGVNANITECITNKKEKGLEYVENLNEAAAEVLENLSTIREEAYSCADDVDGIASILRAIACTKMAGVRGALSVARSIPSLTMNVGKMTYLLSTLKPSLKFCTTTHGLSAFYRESRNIMKNTKLCIQQKVEEAKEIYTALTPLE